MVLTSLTNFAHSEQTNGRYVLTPFAWVFALMFSLSQWATVDSAPIVGVVAIAPDKAPDDLITVDPTDEIGPPDATTDIVDIVPVRPAPSPQPRPIRRGSFFADLRKPLDFNQWRVSTHKNDKQNDYYGGPWKIENIIQAPDRLILKVIAGKDGQRPSMAEMQTRQKYHYGRYEVIMRPSTESGVVSTFFTYTGPWAGDPKDEIDIEFVGKRPKTVEYNYWKNARKGAYSRESLDFDISSGLNLYAFEWHPDEIIWFVNGEEHYRSPRDASRIPSHAGNIFISAWTGVEGMYAWTGPARFEESAQAEYACVSFTPFDGDSYSCSDLWAQDPQFQRDDPNLSSD